MRWFTPLLLSHVAYATLNLKSLRRPPSEQVLASLTEQPRPVPRQAAPRFLTPQTQSELRKTASTVPHNHSNADRAPEFAVNGSALPNVDFDVGESYSGSLPISSNANDTNQLFFWFFPSENETVGKEIAIWLTGGVSPAHRRPRLHLC